MELGEALNLIKESSGEEVHNLVIDKLKDLNEENKTRRQENSTLKEFKNNLIEGFSLNPEEDINTQFQARLDGQKAENEKGMSDLEKLGQKFDDLSKRFELKDEESRENLRKSVLSRRDQELTSALSETNIEPSLMPFVKDSLEKKIKITDNGFTFSDGDKNFNSIGDGVASFIESNPKLQRITNIEGSGEKSTTNQQTQTELTGQITKGQSFGQVVQQ